jgi:sulfur-oxidizing protein SoxY
MKRRGFIVAAGTLIATKAIAQQPQRFQPIQDVEPLLQKLTNGVSPSKGGIVIELPQIAENGNAVPLRMSVDSPMTPQDHVEAIHVIAERNPRPLVATYRFGPAAGKPDVSTRVRLAGTQKLRVLAALSGGRFLLQEQDVLVTSAACLDESM